MKKYLTLLLTLTGCYSHQNCDYIVEQDNVRNRFYIWRCNFPNADELLIQYGSFETFDSAAAIVKDLREHPEHKKEQSDFLKVPK